MKSLFYLAPVYINLKKPDGVGKKVLNHFHVFSGRYDCCVAFYGDDGVVFRTADGDRVVPYNGRHRRFALYEETAAWFRENHPAHVYIRYPRCESRFIGLVRSIKATGADVVVEIPTYPYDLELTSSLRTMVIGLFDIWYRRKLKKHVDRIVTFSEDDAIYGIPTIRTINGIIFDRVPMRKVSARSDDAVHLISVSTNYLCHGFDRMIEGLEKYYAGGGERSIVFDIVGDGPAIAAYEKTIAKCSHAAAHVIIHGFRTGAELEQLYDRADIAVNSLAIHRIGLTRESTLKSKEYAAKGLPMISSSFIDALSEKDNERYVLPVPADETPIDIHRVLAFHDRFGDMDAMTLAKSIRAAAAGVCDMQVTLQPVVSYFDKK